jgi:hypothetical protein
LSDLRSFFKLPKYVNLVLLLIAGIYFVQGDRYFGYTSKQPKTAINVTSDGTGYFAYLPQYIVYQNNNSFDFIHGIVKKYPDKNLSSMLEFDPKSDRIKNKFYVGTPLLQSPFYLAAHGIIKATGQNADGYSRGYRFSIQLAALFWVFIGFISLIHFLRSLGVSFFSATLGITLLALGTNLNTYAVYVPSMSHAYSFAMVSLFLFLSKKWIDTGNSKQLLWMALTLGFIAILRPVNVIIVLFLPFLFENRKVCWFELKNLVTRNYFVLTSAILMFVIVLLVQLLVHHDLNGSWSLYTYSGEGFDNWKQPQFLNVLFSSEKGFFLYGPILILIFPGLYFLFRSKSTYFILGWLLFALSVLYMISSWWDWAYGGSLGMRPLIEYLPVFIIPVVFLFDRIIGWKRSALIGLASLCVIQFQFFQYQFNQRILPFSHVTWEQLAKIKWKTAPRFEWMFYYDHDVIPSNARGLKAGTSEFRDKWKSSGEFAVFNKNPLEFHLYNLKKPICGRLSGEAFLHTDISNPTIYLDYFNNGEKVRSTVQPFGNQVENLETWTKIRQEYFSGPLLFDSIALRLETFGHENGYKNLKIDWYYLK